MALRQRETKLNLFLNSVLGERTPGERRDWRDIKDTSKTSISAVEQHDASRRVSRETPIRHRRGRKERILRKNLEKVRFIKVKEIHPDAPLPHLARKQSTRFNISEKNPEKLHERKHHQTGSTSMNDAISLVLRLLSALPRHAPSLGHDRGCDAMSSRWNTMIK